MSARLRWIAIGGLALVVVTVHPAAAAVQSLAIRGYVIEQTCYGEDLFVDMSAVHESSSEPVRFRWDFENDGRWDTPPRIDPSESTLYVGDGQEITVRVGAKNPEGDRAQDRFSFAAVDCIPG